MTDDLEDFLEDFPCLPTQEAPNVSTDDPVESYLPEAVEALDGCDDPQQQLVALRQKFTETPDAYLEAIVASSRYHVQAMLALKKDRRADAILAHLLKRGGVSDTTALRDDGHRNAGGAAMSALRDAGLVITSTPVGGGNFRYELDLRSINLSRGERTYLSAQSKRRLLAYHDDRCNLCRSEKDLQFDHRVG